MFPTPKNKIPTSINDFYKQTKAGRRAVPMTTPTPVDASLRQKFSASVQDVQELTGVARRVMMAHNAMLTGQIDIGSINSSLQHFPYVYHEIDGNLSHLYNTNNRQELVQAFQMNARRSSDIRNTINNLMNDMQLFVQRRGRG